MSVVGLDLGTSRVKAVCFDEDWTVADLHAEATTVQRPHPGWSEQDMESVWQAASRALRAVARDGITLIAVTAQGDGCWLIGRDGTPIRPAILWNDNRAAPMIDEWDAEGTLDVAFRRTGCDGAPGLAHAQLRWLAAHEPASLDRATTLLSCGSWVHYRLTGERVQHVSDLHNPFLDAATGRPDEELLNRYGLSGLRHLLPPAVAGADGVHCLQPRVAEELSLPAGVPVALAPYDVVSSAIGVGAIRPGDAAAILGTTMCITAATAAPDLTPPRGGMSLPVGPPGRWLRAYATLAGTEVLDWMAALVGLRGAAELIELASAATAPDAPLLVPYLSPAGERAPFRDAAARGALAGLTLRHDRADIARATVDGVTLAILDCLRATDAHPRRLSLSGGGAQNRHWCQTISDATGVAAVSPDIPETGARGAALAGAVAIGRYPGLEEACADAVRPGRVHTPDLARNRQLDRAYHRLLAARDLGATHL